MGAFELSLIALGLSMDAFAVSICHGLALPRMSWSHALIVGLYFGVSQALMPLIGFFVGQQFSHLIASYDHWIAFVLLTVIGGKMAMESLQERGCRDRSCPEACCDDRECPDGKRPEAEEVSLSLAIMLPLAIATSIDALAVGVSFAFLQVRILSAATVIGVITLLTCVGGVKVGNAFGSRFRAKAELAGGVTLILIGLKILLEHTGFLPF